jgi:large subunit ribosomal protein L2
MTSQDLSEITTKKPLKSLIKSKKMNSGRNNQGKITTRHRGGGVRRHYRLLDHGIAAGLTLTVEEIEYDPNRSARIARVKDQHGLYHYILADTQMQKGKTLQTGEEAPVEPSNRMQLSRIPVGSQIYAIEINPGKGGQMVRSAGTKAQLMAKEDNYAMVRMPSGEVRKFRLECEATIGVVGNVQHQNVKLGSAGRRRRMGWRPSVHSKAMNPVDHPMGGGEGKTGPGRNPKTPWGKPALGYKTRTRKSTNKMIVRSRHEAKRKK